MRTLVRDSFLNRFVKLEHLDPELFYDVYLCNKPTKRVRLRGDIISDFVTSVKDWKPQSLKVVYAVNKPYTLVCDLKTGTGILVCEPEDPEEDPWVEEVRVSEEDGDLVVEGGGVRVGFVFYSGYYYYSFLGWL